MNKDFQDIFYVFNYACFFNLFNITDYLVLKCWDRIALTEVLLAVIRVLSSTLCSSRAKRLNRDNWFWGTMGLTSPILAYLIILLLKPITKWKSNNIEEENDKSSNDSIKNGVTKDAVPYSFEDKKHEENLNSNSPLKF